MVPSVGGQGAWEGERHLSALRDHLQTQILQFTADASATGSDN